MNCEDSNNVDIAEEAFKLILNSLAWKNRYFALVHNNMSKEQKFIKKNFFLLLCINQIENCTVSDIEKLVCESRSAISIAVTKLCHDGLVTKHPPELGDDGRKVYFRITEKGDKKMSEYQQIIKNDIGEFFERMPEDSKKCFLAGIFNLNKAFKNMDITTVHKEVY